MQYDDGSGDVTPGEDIVVDTANGQVDLGPASYDSDHDGVADSVIVADGDEVMVITDADHDGHADHIRAYDQDGHEVDPKTGEPLGPDGDTGSTGDTTGHDTGDDGGNVSPVSNTGDGHDNTGDAGASGHSGDITVADSSGKTVDVGSPTVDLDKDGKPDTAVVRGSDGTVTAFTDRDGDGTADQITQVSANGSVVVGVHDGSGGWQVVATGHVDSEGNLVKDAEPDPNASIHLPSGGESSDPGTDTHNTDTHTTDTHTTDTHTTDSHTSDTHGTPAGNGDITVSAGGKDYDLGRPTADMDGDGKPDTFVSKQADGTITGYTDVDGNGTADRITQISPDGNVVIAEADGNGGWHQVATGHLDSDGNFVPDQGVTSGAAG